MNSKWLFSSPPNEAVFTTRQVLDKEEWIACVYHDKDDGAWQFHHQNSNADESDAKTVALKTIVEIDSSIIELSDLPLGWKAYRRSPNHNWIKCPIEVVKLDSEN